MAALRCPTLSAIDQPTGRGTADVATVGGEKTGRWSGRTERQPKPRRFVLSPRTCLLFCLLAFAFAGRLAVAMPNKQPGKATEARTHYQVSAPAVVIPPCESSSLGLMLRKVSPELTIDFQCLPGIHLSRLQPHRFLGVSLPKNRCPARSLLFSALSPAGGGRASRRNASEGFCCSASSSPAASPPPAVALRSPPLPQLPFSSSSAARPTARQPAISQRGTGR